MKPKIRFSAVLLVAVFVFLLVSCGEKTPVDVLGGFIASVKNCDTDGTVNAVVSPASIGGHVYSIAEAKKSADEYGLETLVKIYSTIKYTVISENVEKDEAGSEIVITDKDRQTIRIEISAPDFASVISLTMSEMMYSSKSKTEVIMDFLDDGTVARHMNKMTVDVVVVKENDGWKIPFSQSENKEFYESLGLSYFASWILG